MKTVVPFDARVRCKPTKIEKENLQCSHLKFLWQKLIVALYIKLIKENVSIVDNKKIKDVVIQKIAVRN